MTRVTEALRQAALLDEEIRLSSGRAAAVPRGISLSPQPLRPGLVNVVAAPEADGRVDPHVSPVEQPVTVAPRFLVPPARVAAPDPFVAPSGARTLVANPGASQESVQQYRRIATALQEIQDRSGWAGPAGHERTLKTVLVTSALTGEGKTLTVINLALTLSEDFGRQVLVIDADVRRPAIHDVLGLSNAVGLTDVLRPGIEHLPLHEVSSRLSVLTAGRAPFDPRNLASDRMRSLLRDAASSFDWVLVDAPAVDRAPDARLLAGVSRAVLFVIARGTTPFSTVERAMSEIGRGCIIGSVLNEVPAGLVRRREVNRRRVHRVQTRRGPRER